MILIMADLHFDMWRRDERDPFDGIARSLTDLDAVIIAGDLGNDAIKHWPRALDRLGKLIAPEKIWVMPGNHDYWHGSLAMDGELERITCDSGAHFAQKRVIEIADTRYYCCTLWTDFRLTGDSHDAMLRALAVMPDYWMITLGRRPSRHIHPIDTVVVHDDHLGWLTAQFQLPWHGKRIVVTHHAPSAAVMGKIDGLSAAFGSDLDDWIRDHRPDGWYFGHTHRPVSGLVHGVPVINVSLGYPDDVRGTDPSELLLRGLIMDGDVP